MSLNKLTLAQAGRRVGKVNEDLRLSALLALERQVEIVLDRMAPEEIEVLAQSDESPPPDWFMEKWADEMAYLGDLELEFLATYGPLRPDDPI